jgi:hypothetical protein
VFYLQKIVYPDENMKIDDPFPQHFRVVASTPPFRKNSILVRFV